MQLTTSKLPQINTAHNYYPALYTYRLYTRTDDSNNDYCYLSLRSVGQEEQNRRRHPHVHAPIPVDGHAHIQGQILLRSDGHQSQIRHDGRPLRARVTYKPNIIRAQYIM